MASRKRFIAAGLITVGLLVGLTLILAASTALAGATPKRAAALPVIDNFEGGMPAGWFQYGDYGSGTAIATNIVATDTLPGAATGNHALEIAYTSGGWGAGTGRNVPGEDWSSYDGFSFWFRGVGSGALYRVILSDNPNPAVPGDSAERFAYEFNDTVAGWRLVSIPWSAFFRDPGYQPGGAPNDGLTLTQVQAYAFALPSGNTATVLVDDVRLFKDAIVDDFEGGMPTGWFSYGDYGSGTAIATNVVATDTVPGAPAGNHALEIAYTSAGWGAGTGKNIPGEDWSGANGFSFWFRGVGSGALYRVILSDNPNPAVPGDSAERFAYEFNDTLAGWRQIVIPWSAFFRDPGYQPGGALNDGLTLTQVQAYALALPSGNTANVYLDHVALFSDGQAEVKVGFTANAYSTEEGQAAEINVVLNVASAQPVTVTYATADGTAQAGSDYTAATGQLVFAPGVTAQTFMVLTADDTVEEPNETVALSLSAPQGAQLGAKATATLTIVDDDKPALSGKSVIVDDFEDGLLPSGVDENGVGVGFVTWNAPGAGVAITVTDAPPAAVPGAAAGNKVLKEDLTLASGQWAGFTHAFTNAAADEWLSQDWSSYEGISFWLYGNNTGGTLFVDLQDNRNPGSITDDAERWSIDIPDNFTGWQFFQIPFGDFHRKDIGNGAPNDGLGLTQVHGYAIGGFGSVNMGAQSYFVDQVAIYGNTGAVPLPLQVEFAATGYGVIEGAAAVVTVSLTITATEPVTVTYRTAEGYAIPDRDYTPVSGTLTFAAGETEKTFTVVTMDNLKAAGDKTLMLNLAGPVNAELGFRRRAVLTIEDDEAADTRLLDDFEGSHQFTTAGNVTLGITEVMQGAPLALPAQGKYEQVLRAAFDTASGPASFTRTYPAGQDWRSHQGLSFWYYGGNSGQNVTVELLDNRGTPIAAATPQDLPLVWSDEFNDPAGTPPNANVWSHEIGDGTLNGIPGWGNSESQYYTDSTENAATDGAGNLVISVKALEASTDKSCWYGPCEYTSARLISANKAEFQYGRVESRIWVPTGEDGLWPAFWMLGTNIGQVGWPQSGEIDIMEYVSRIPNEVFGTIHGPGYSGGNGIGHTYTFPSGVAGSYHTFSIEWAPDQIHWYVDGINYHNATPADIPAGKEWVYNHPFYLILNMAIGGNFGGAISDQLTFPQEMKVDYVRVYGAQDTSERFTAAFTDNFSGWRKVLLPFRNFTRAASQPAGAPNDGLTLSQVWGYGFGLPQGASGTIYLDQVRLADLQVNFLPLIVR